MNFITASTDDIPAIRAIAYECWPVAYNGIISAAQIEYMLQEMYSETSLKQQMNEGCEFVFTQVENETIGFASYSMLDNTRSKLHKLYLLSNKKSKGYGKLLLEEVMRRASLKDAKTMELQVNKNNRSKDFYHRMGFDIKEELVLNIGNGFVMDDYVMCKILEPTLYP